ncbi:unnamed protein product [Lactuca saligna]|uniref:Uncharacterized protein n=1 Tax=Lactuca saligna TaxID=75948 RepID=A0AA35Y676_LACSI|nr:unnamed protein product [Lactuca saligna]
MSGSVSSSPEGSFQHEKPSLVDELGTWFHSLSFGAYAPAQTSTLMAVAADRVFHASVNDRHLKVLQGVVASMREEVRDSEAVRQVLSEQDCIVACQKVALEDHVATLEDHSKEGVVLLNYKVIESLEFSSGIQGVRDACESLGFEKGKQLSGYSTSSGEPEVPYLGHVARRDEEVDVALSSLS